MASNPVSVYADELLFAEDLVTHAFRHNTEVRLSFHPKRHGACVYFGFNDTMKTAVEFIENRIDVDSDFNRFEERNYVNGETYKMFAKEIWKLCFSEGFEPEFFLYYSAYIAALAERFYNAEVLEAPTLAVQAIVEGFCGYDMHSGGWGALDTVAKKFATVAADVEDLYTPPSTPPESDDEIDFPIRAYREAIEIDSEDETDSGGEADSEGETDSEGEGAESDDSF